MTTSTSNSIDRRKLLAGQCGDCHGRRGGQPAVSVAAPCSAGGSGQKAVRRPRPTVNVTPEELMKPGPLPDLVLGKEDAPITIVEYASMTCGHCANFHNKVLPALKEKYIDTGKVRFIMREFPLDERAALASMMARCAGGDKTCPLISVLFAKQDEWALRAQRPPARALQVRPAGGLHQETLRQVPDRPEAARGHHVPCAPRPTPFGVSSTPTFFINGKKLDGADRSRSSTRRLAPLI